MRTPRARGFTLIELLVVIAIIAILAAILFPVFAKARDRSMTIACMSNMKQVGTAVQMYLGDSDGKYPMNRYEAEPAAHNWRTSLFPYIQSEDVLRCPTNTLAKQFPKVTEESGKYPISYSTNGSVFYNYVFGLRPTSITDIKDPADTMYILESRGRWPDLGPWTLNYRAWNPRTGQHDDPKLGAFQVHNKRMNVVFADTHARSVTLWQTLDEDLWKSRDPIYQGQKLRDLYVYLPNEYK